MQRREVRFASGGLRLAGHLRVPAGAGAGHDTGAGAGAGAGRDRSEAHGPGLPAVVLTGPFTGVKEQVTGTYARRLAEAGYVTLAFDHRNFGESEGEPRQHEDAAGKLADLRDALSYVAGLAEVDARRVAVCGVCLGTAYALKFAAFDPRVRALALVAGAYNDPREMRRGMGADGYRAQLARMAEVASREYAGAEPEYLPAVAPGGQPAAMAGQEPFDYYGTDRAASRGWRNRVTALSIRELITLDAASAIEFLAPTPLLVVHGETDGYCSPAAAAALYERAGQPKAIAWLPTSNHIDLYDNDEFVAPAVARVAAWFDEHLAVPQAAVPA